MSDVIRRRLRLEGRVQGVGLRWRAARAAERAGVAGWVRNEDDGTVTLELQGDEARIDQMIGEVLKAPYAQIDRVTVKSVAVEEEWGFRVRH